MRLASKLMLASALTVALGALAQGQPPPGRGPGGGGFGGMGAMLDNKGLQTELKLTDEQVTKAKAATDEVRKKHDEEFKKAREMSPEERQTLMKSVSAETTKALSDVLKPDQMKRLKQIMLQQAIRMRGAAALNDDEVQTQLKLTDDQKKQIKEVADETGKEVMGLFQEAQGDREKMQEIRKKAESLNKEGMSKVSALLTADQKKELKTLQGEPYEIKFERPMRQPQ
jgi:Spy/CpxP family protein refolding chaperone